jgi:proton glutamate symport protein
VRRLSLTQWIVISVVAGIVVGILFQFFAPHVFQADPDQLSAGELLVRTSFEFAKDLFLRLLKMIIVPLILTSIITGVLAVGDGEGIGRIGLKTMIYYLSTSTLAILTGLVLVNLIRPGVGAHIVLEEAPATLEVVEQTPLEFLREFLLDLVPLNPFRAMVEGDILQVIVFSLLVGFFITRISEPYRGSLTRLFQGGFEVMMRVVHFVFLFAPVGIFALLVRMVASEGVEAFKSLAWYALTVLLALLIHAGVTLPIILGTFGRVNPVRHLGAMWPALMVAFSTASSSGTLPLTMECAEKRAKVSNRVTSFVLPLGATINMDGTALYECVAAVFIAQIYASQGAIPPLTVGQQLLVVVTALAASIGAAGVPMAGLVMMSIILKALGLPLEAVGYILAVDRILDMCRTSVNVWSDSCGVAVVARSEGETEIV